RCIDLGDLTAALEVDVHLAVSIAHAELGLCAQVYGADVPPTGSVKDARRLRITIEREDVLRRWIEQDAVGILGGPGFPQHGEGLEVEHHDRAVAPRSREAMARRKVECHAVCAVDARDFT